MEKYAKLMKGLEMCAGPKCCLDGCPYYGETRGGMTCRARLLADAAITINNESALRESAEEGLRNAVEELGKLKEVIAYPGHDVFVVKGEKEFMVPAVPAFIDSIDLESNEMRIHVWEGLI